MGYVSYEALPGSTWLCLALLGSWLPHEDLASAAALLTSQVGKKSLNSKRLYKHHKLKTAKEQCKKMHNNELEKESVLNNSAIGSIIFEI